MSEVAALLAMIGNLSEFHREHEKVLRTASITPGARGRSGVSEDAKALADRWSSVSPEERPSAARS